MSLRVANMIVCYQFSKLFTLIISNTLCLKFLEISCLLKRRLMTLSLPYGQHDAVASSQLAYLNTATGKKWKQLAILLYKVSG